MSVATRLSLWYEIKLYSMYHMPISTPNGKKSIPKIIFFTQFWFGKRPWGKGMLVW